MPNNISLVIVWLLLSPLATKTVSSGSSLLEQDATALLHFLAGLSKGSGDAEELKGWNASWSANACSWTGVSCDSRNLSVVGLHLSGKGLSGAISPALGQLSSLQSLDLSFNSLNGSIPTAVFDQCLHLARLNLSSNQLSGTIPLGITNRSALRSLDFSFNHLHGSLPSNIGRLWQLIEVKLSYNNLTGPVPFSLSNCTWLEVLDLQGNRFDGPIPAELSALSRMEMLLLSYNDLSGSIPVGLVLNFSQLLHFEVGYNQLSGHLLPELGRLRKLQEMWTNYNNFTGAIPSTLGNLSHLQKLVTGHNQLTGRLPDSLVQLTELTGLAITQNQLTGKIPEWLANLTRLSILRCGSNHLTGAIPRAIGRMAVLADIRFYENLLSGEIPWEIGNCTSLTVLDLLGNHAIGGRIPDTLSRLQSLTSLDLSINRIVGSIPDGLSNCTMLRNLSLGYNNLTGSLSPAVIAGFSNLVWLTLQHNSLSGVIPAGLGNMRQVTMMDLSGNQFSGSIPVLLGDCVELIVLNLSQNLLTGEIPSQLGLDLQSLEQLDLSVNSLSGSLPASLCNMAALTVLNVSYNLLQGSVPSSCTARKLNGSSFVGNIGLCGPIVDRACTSARSRSLSPRFKAIVAAAGILVVIALALLVAVCLRPKAAGRRRAGLDPTPFSSVRVPLRVTRQDLWRMTSDFSEDHLIGEGADAKVYRGIFLDGRVVAVKLLKQRGGDHDEQSQRSFVRELASLGKARHRNLLRILGFCAESDVRALVLELMPNGSLEQHLHHRQVMHPQDKRGIVLSWEQSKAIVVGVAQALVYLHHEGAKPIVHCDVKPSNILLDAEMEPHLADFGLAKVCAGYNEMSGVVSTTSLRGTIGYIAPERAVSGRITPKADVYSFGVVLLEILTHVSPLSDEFADDRTALAKWVHSTLENDISATCSVVAPSLLQSATEQHVDQMIATLRIALLCCHDNPSTRPTMREAARALDHFLNL